jgi:cytochrome c peroxidase
MNFHALGTRDLYLQGGVNTGPDDQRNLGRGMFTKDPNDNYRFKVPQLYNLKDYVTFFHGSSKTSLEEVIDFKIKAQSENERVTKDRLSPLFQPLDLSQAEKNALLDFLENGLYDSEINRFVPAEVPSGLCFPNNDAQSRSDLGCD